MHAYFGSTCAIPPRSSSSSFHITCTIPIPSGLALILSRLFPRSHLHQSQSAALSSWIFFSGNPQSEPNRTQNYVFVQSPPLFFAAALFYPIPRLSFLSSLHLPGSTIHHPHSSLRLHHHPSSIHLPVHSPPLLAALRCHAFISLSSSYSPARNLRLPLAPSPLPARFLSRIITYDALPPSLKRAAACRWGARRADSRIRISRRQKKEQTSPLRRPKAGCCINLVWLLYIQLYCSARACVRVTYLAYILACCTAARRRVLVVDALNFLK